MILGKRYTLYSYMEAGKQADGEPGKTTWSDGGFEGWNNVEPEVAQVGPTPWPAPVVEKSSAPKGSRRSLVPVIGAVIGIVMTAAVWALVARGENSLEPSALEIDPSSKDEVLAGISDAELYVLDVENIETHIHVQLNILVDGESVVIPQVGVDMDTYTAAPIHTHSEDGILHVETDTLHPKAPTLLDFLELWLGRDSAEHPCYNLVEEPCRAVVLRGGRNFDPEGELQDGDFVEIRATRQ